ncbi:MAG: 5'/3'-nucleotidase SurE [Candidatus Goldiibacteriota bacterium]
MKPYILITNDDGIRSGGIKAVYEAVKDFADVLVAAPARERSGASNSVTIWKSIKVKKQKFLDASGYAVSGTPADCVKLGVLSLAKRKPDLVISGINHGPNFGRFILYSGTVGGATEAALRGIPSIAASLDDFEKKADFSFAGEVVRSMAKAFFSKKIRINSDTIININIPRHKRDEVKGFKVLPKGNCEYVESYEKFSDNGSETYRWMVNERVEGSALSMPDSVAVRSGYVVITPLHIDTTNHTGMSRLKKEMLKKGVMPEGFVLPASRRKKA